MSLHKALLLGLETTLEEALESGLHGCPKKEAIAQSEVHGGHKEANGLHHIPTQLPKSQPDGTDCLK